jgi:hypothetical protein
MKIEIRKTRAEDFLNLGYDAEQLGACHAYLSNSLHAWTGVIEDKIACVWGLIPPSILSDNAYLWLLTTDVVDEHRFTFIRHSQMVVQIMLEDFPTIVGHVLADHERSKRWLKWLGVTFKPSIEAGPTRIVPFELRRALRG